MITTRINLKRILCLTAFALTILAPVIFNILLYHICLFPFGMGPGIVSAILWIILFIWYRKYFSGIFVQRAS